MEKAVKDVEEATVGETVIEHVDACFFWLLTLKHQ